MNKLAVFDICDTLYPENTTVGFVKYSVSIKNIYYILFNNKFIKILNYIIHKLFGRDIIRTILIGNLQGINKTNLSQSAACYISQLKVNRKIEDMLLQYKKDGYDVILCSATLDIVANEIQKHYGLTSAFSSKLQFKEDYCQGFLKYDLLGKKEKVFKEFIKKYDRVEFVTDNFSDANCIQFCDKFIAVIPKGKDKNIKYWKKNMITNMVIL